MKKNFALLVLTLVFSIGTVFAQPHSHHYGDRGHWEYRYDDPHHHHHDHHCHHHDHPTVVHHHDDGAAVAAAVIGTVATVALIDAIAEQHAENKAQQQAQQKQAQAIAVQEHRDGFAIHWGDAKK